MANNRMYLINEELGECIFIAKYFPVTGWYVKNDDLVDALNKIFHRTDYPDVPCEEFKWEELLKKGIFAKGGMDGNTDWEIAYEHIEGDKREVVMEGATCNPLEVNK
jgi:hypothetical protein